MHSDTNNRLQAPSIKRRSCSSLRTQSEPAALIQRLYAARGYDPSDISALGQIPSYKGLAGSEEAARLIADAIEANAHIRIVGDYDVDGATSTALVHEALGMLGASRVSHLVPNRVTQGYGLTPSLAEKAAAEGAELLITVDNGVSAHDGVKAARDAGMKIVVTDHHAPGATLPDADAIINPAIPGQDFPSTSLAGVGVAFYVMAAVRAELDSRGAFGQLDKPNLSSLLDLVALGTVADVVRLDALNRVLVAAGLRRMRHGLTRVGIQELVTVANRDLCHLVASDLAFSIAPRLNAAGRLDDMSVGIECLLTRDVMNAQLLARTLDSINKDRREKEQSMREKAVESVDALIQDLDNGAIPAGLCVFESSWHEGIVGLVAGKLKEKYHRPTVAFAPGADGMLKGSARSIEGIHVRDVLAGIEARCPGLLPRFGGHAMAAGMSIDARRLDEFRALWSETLEEHADPACFDQEIVTDGELSTEELCMASAHAIEGAGPWGQGFPEPLFDGMFEVVSSNVIGQDGNHLRLRLRDPRDGRTLPAVAFNHAQLGMADRPKRDGVRFVYRLAVNRYRGDENLQLVVEGYDLALSCN